MKSTVHGKDHSGVEVINITKHGIWLFTGDNELFISFEKFPWFRHASVSGILNVERPNPNYLHWPDLDMDLTVESVRCFPLISKSRPPIRRVDQRRPKLFHNQKAIRAQIPLERHSETTLDPSKDSARPVPIKRKTETRDQSRARRIGNIDK